MKKMLFCIAIVLLALFSCTPEEQPPVVSYVFSDVSVVAGQTSAIITCYNESVDDDKVHASVLLSKNENITNATKYPLNLQNDTLRGTINGLEQNTMYFFCFEVYTANEHKRADEIHHFQTTGGNGNVTVTTSEAINITQTTATGGGSVVTDGNYTVSMRGVCWDTVPNPNALQSPHLASGQGTGAFLVNITNLTSGTLYYMRAYALCNDVVYYGNEVNFTTQVGQAPSVTTSEVTNITRTSALASGNVTDAGGLEVIERGVCWSTAHAPNIEGSHANNGTGTGAFSIEIGELIPNTTYYVRAYAQNAKGIAYGDEVEFKTAEDVSSPIVNTLQVTNITSTTATGGGNVTNDGGATVTERGICWSTNHNPTVNDEHASNDTGLGEFTVVMADLTPGTTYYVRAYAENSQGVSYGMEVSFVTVANPPTVTTGDVSNITQTTALGSGTVIDDGGLEITERGLCWSTNHNPTLNDSHASNGIGTGGFTVEMTGLTSNTTYYVRAYAINSQGTAYGNEKEFKTSQNVSAPMVTTSEVSNITQTTAKGGGNVTNDGGASVTERGICWSTEHNPTISNSHTNSGTGTGEFNCNMSGLTAGTTYYVRAYAKNSQGTSYGAEVSFITEQEITLPTVTTAQVSNITQTTATGGGNVTATGNATVTERGICWGTSHNPTTSSSHASNGSGTGTYSVNMTNLTPNTTYYVRAYAKNSAGTAYGAEVSFTTLQNVSLPTVTTSQVTSITQTTATGGGNVTSAGGATVTERGICWSTSHNPTTSNTHANNGTGTGTYTVNMTNLTANTTYYVRAYAINSAGTAYGAEVSFTTSQIPTYTVSVSANPSNGGSVSGGGNYNYGQNCTVQATANSGYTFTNWTENGNQVSTNANYTFTVTSNRTLVANYSNAPQGAINGLFTINVNGNQVYFSKGNLQYQASSQTWRFAENQWDFVGTQNPPQGYPSGGTVTGSDNHYISQTYNGWIDLFGWGTSGWNNGNVYYQPWDSQNNGNSSQGYGYGPTDGTNYTYDLTGTYSQSDWGVHNVINNTTGQWRTLTQFEWDYVLSSRTTTSGIRYAKAQITGVNNNIVSGVILFPDYWSPNIYNPSNYNQSGASYNSNTISASQWITFEAAGAIFLPAAGNRNGTSVNRVGWDGYYWTASNSGYINAGVVMFDDSSFYYTSSSSCRNYGQSVRLVQDK